MTPKTLPAGPRGVAHRIHGTSELNQNAIAARFNDASVVGFNPGVDYLSVQTSKTCPPSFFVFLNKARVSDHVSNEDSRKPSLDALFRHVMCLLSEQPTGEILCASEGRVHLVPESALGQTRKWASI